MCIKYSHLNYLISCFVPQDSRFAAMFERPEFHVDTESEEYKLLNPLVAKVDKVGRWNLGGFTQKGP